MEALPKQIKLFRTRDQKRPYLEWFTRIRDQRAKQKIQARIDRLSLGNHGHTNSYWKEYKEEKRDANRRL